VSGRIDPHFLVLGTSWRRVVSFTPEEKPRYTSDRRLGGFENRPGRRGEEENFWPYRDSNSDPLVAQPVASRYIIHSEQ
jgi:hypothetical protein